MILEFLVRSTGAVRSRIRNCWFRILGVRMEGYVWLRNVSIPRQWSDIRLGKGVALDDGVTLLCSSESKPNKLWIGAGTYVNRDSILDASCSLQIGRDCMIGPGCYITDHDHGWVPGETPASQPLIAAPTRLHDRVWIGAHVVILKGVTIGSDAVVAAGAVVTKDVAPGTRVAGVPARPLRES